MIAALTIASILQQKHESFVDKLPGFLVEWKMVAVPEGTASMGGKEHAVKKIWIGETEVTWDMYDVFAFRMDLTPEQNAADFDAENRPSRPYGAPDRGFGHSGFAALSMAHPAAVKFCEWLSKKTGRKYRLPTEAEWEYAARAGATAEPTPLGDYAWFWDNSDSVAHKVKSRKPNAWGLYDMLGNTAEWCDGSLGKDPVVRGGSFYHKAEQVKFTTREPYDEAWQLRDAQRPKSVWWFSDGEMVGMRLVCEG
jgi:formylglycine-generating enzyme required for sulfatase activity